MFKKYMLSALAMCSFAQAQNSSSELALFAGAGVVGTTIGLWTLGRLAYGPIVVGCVRARYAPAIAQLHAFGLYAQNYVWDAVVEQQLCTNLKNLAVQFHNMNRDKLGITVMFDLLQGTPAGSISSDYYAYPLMQYMHDLERYIKSLRFINALGLHSEREAVAILLQQLTYIRDLLRSDIDLNREEQMFHQARAMLQVPQVNVVAQVQEPAQTTIHIY